MKRNNQSEKGVDRIMDCRVVTIPGDGIGPEIVREACKVLDRVGQVYGHSFSYTEILMGGCSIRRVRRAADGRGA